MASFHFAYDLRYIVGFRLEWFSESTQFVWRASIAWTFLLLAGIMCSYSKNNLKRSLRYLVFAFVIWIVTFVAAVDIPISFGIIFCIGASTLIDSLLSRLGIAPSSLAACATFLVLFYLMYNTSEGYIQLGSFKYDLPRGLYDSGWLAWLGFPSPRFSSGDYYPLLPYFFMYAAGISFGRFMKGRSYPAWFVNLKCRPLEFFGRHSLLIYIVHQPILIGVSYALGALLL